MGRMHHVGSTVAALSLLAFSVGCSDHEYPSCEDGCDEAAVCWYAKNICVPAPGGDGTCPEGTVYQDCATGSCATCRDCVPACIPEDMLAAASTHARDGAVACSDGSRGAASRLQRTSLPESTRASSS